MTNTHTHTPNTHTHTHTHTHAGGVDSAAAVHGPHVHEVQCRPPRLPAERAGQDAGQQIRDHAPRNRLGRPQTRPGTSLTHTISLSNLHAQKQTLSLSHTHSHTHTFSLSHAHTHTHCLSLSHTHTHALSPSLSHTQVEKLPAGRTVFRGLGDPF